MAKKKIVGLLGADEDWSGMVDELVGVHEIVDNEMNISAEGSGESSAETASEEKKVIPDVSPASAFVPTQAAGDVEQKDNSGIVREKKRRAGRPRKDSGVQEREVSASVQIHLVAPSDLFRDFQLLCRMRGMSVSGAIKNLMKSELKKNASTFEKAKQLWNL